MVVVVDANADAKVCASALRTPLFHTIHRGIAAVVCSALGKRFQLLCVVLAGTIRFTIRLTTWSRKIGSGVLEKPWNFFNQESLAYIGGSVAEWLACWTQVQKGPGCGGNCRPGGE